MKKALTLALLLIACPAALGEARLQYADAVRIAVVTNRPLVSFIGIAPFDVEGCVSVYAEEITGYQRGWAVISVPCEGSSTGHVEMEVVKNPTPKTVKDAIPQRMQVGDKFEWKKSEATKKVEQAISNQFSPRAPTTHTHSCPRGHGTWDHLSNPGHNCPVCGIQVLVQDSTPRTVTLGSARSYKPVISATVFQSDCPTCPNYRPK